MYQRKESAKNTYYPSFLCMEVDTPDYLDALMRMPFDERTEAAFLHEYIHYLQDRPYNGFRERPYRNDCRSGQMDCW